MPSTTVQSDRTRERLLSKIQPEACPVAFAAHRLHNSSSTKQSERKRLARRIEKNGRPAAVACISCYKRGLRCLRWDLKSSCSVCSLTGSPCVVPPSLVTFIGEKWQEATDLALSHIEDDGFNYTRLPRVTIESDSSSARSFKAKRETEVVDDLLTVPTVATSQLAIELSSTIEKNCGSAVASTTTDRVYSIIDHKSEEASSSQVGCGTYEPSITITAIAPEVPDSQPSPSSQPNDQDDEILPPVLDEAPRVAVEKCSNQSPATQAVDYNTQIVFDSQPSQGITFEQDTVSNGGSSNDLEFIAHHPQVSVGQWTSSDSASDTPSGAEDSDEDLVDFLSDTDESETGHAEDSRLRTFGLNRMTSGDTIFSSPLGACIDSTPSDRAAKHMYFVTRQSIRHTSSDCCLDSEESSESIVGRSCDWSPRRSTPDLLHQKILPDQEAEPLPCMSDGPRPYSDGEEEVSQTPRRKRSCSAAIHDGKGGNFIPKKNRHNPSVEHRIGGFIKSPGNFEPFIHGCDENEVANYSATKGGALISSSSPVRLRSTIDEVHEALIQPSQTVYDGLTDEELLALPECLLEQRSSGT